MDKALALKEVWEIQRNGNLVEIWGHKVQLSCGMTVEVT